MNVIFLDGDRCLKKDLYCNSKYQVDDLGTVYSQKGRPLKYSVNPNGYAIVQIIIDGKQVGRSVHTLVARTFIDGYQEGLQVNHKDGNKLNNRADNLEWVTREENTRHSIEVLGNTNIGALNPMSKKVYGYKKDTMELEFEFPSVADAARYFAGDNKRKARSIQNIISQNASGSNKKKSYHGYVWRYEKLDFK